MHVQEGGARPTVVNKVCKEAVLGILGPAIFRRKGCLAGQSFCLTNAIAIAPTTELVIEKGRNDSGNTRGTQLLRPIQHLNVDPKHPGRERLDRPTLQLRREKAGPCSTATRALWCARQQPIGDSQTIARDAGGDDRHNALQGQLLHEQILET